jgi:hypothetical protein
VILPRSPIAGLCPTSCAHRPTSTTKLCAQAYTLCALQAACVHRQPLWVAVYSEADYSEAE